ncbi:MAG: LysR family transcriptional regulator [Lachnospiraceae bacterium]|nr:LysR family transcriptional regulator [Lachnospiraceae bacterium]
MKLQQLRYFQSACEQKSITKAAAALHVSQPTITIAIRELEEEFNLVLMNRTTKKFQLTTAGELFLEKSNFLLKEVDTFERNMTELGRHKKTIRLGIPVMAGSYFLPILLPSYKILCPNSQLEIVENGSKGLLSDLKNENLDCAILTNVTDVAFNQIDVYEDEMLFCVSKKNPLAQNRKIKIEQLDGVPLVLFRGANFALTDLIADLFHQSGANMNVIYETLQFTNVQQMVSTDLAGGFVNKRLCHTIPNSVGISLVPSITYTARLLWPKNQKPYYELQQLIDFCKKFD